MKSPSPLDNVRVVLSHTTHPGNIGAAARAMKTMGLARLYLVNPKSFPDAQATAMASGAVDVLDHAQVCASLDDALQGTVLAAALTTRPRDLPHEIYDARQAACELVEQGRRHEVAIVFGTEMSGLTIAEVSKCRLLVRIPANPNYTSLNLAAAVQVMAYELRMALPEVEKISASPGYEPASFEEVEMFYRHLESSLVASGFLDPEQPKRLMQRLRRLFARSRLEKEEVNILRGILRAMSE